MTTNSIINDKTTQAARVALDGLALRQQMISRNVANIDTPGYHAQNISFENVIQNVIKTSEANTGFQMEKTNSAHLGKLGESALSPLVQAVDRMGGSERVDENNVDIDTEMIEMTDTALRYQTISTVLSKKLLLLKAIANAR